MQRRDFLKTTAAAAAAPLATSLIPQGGFARQGTQPSPKAAQFASRIKPIQPEERKGRIERAQALMADKNIDALLLEGGTSMMYFAGISWGRSERLFAMVLPKKGEPFFVAPKFEEARALEQVGTRTLYTWEEDEDPYAIFEKRFREQDLLNSIVGVEEQTRFFVTDNLRRALPAVSLVSGTDITAGCRTVKSAHELELMQIANDITRAVFTEAAGTLKAGMKERELGSAISKLFSEYGVGGGALVLFGEASAYPHGTVKEHTLQEGQIVLIDGGCSVEGYSSDVTRTTVFGTPTEKMKTVWSAVRKAQDAALTTARPGVPCEYVDAAARAIITAEGYGPGYKYFTHRVGHGIGMEGHEWNYLVHGNKTRLKAGNTFSNEPGIYIPGEFGIRLEDELVITEDGARLMLPQAESLERIFG